MTRLYLFQCTVCETKCIVAAQEDEEWDAMIECESCWITGDPVTWKLIKGVK